MKNRKNHPQTANTECIPPVYHLCTTCIQRPQNNVNYLLFMNILTILLSFQHIKKSPINTGFTGLINILYYLRNSQLADTLCKHSNNTTIRIFTRFFLFLYIIFVLLFSFLIHQNHFKYLIAYSKLTNTLILRQICTVIIMLISIIS